MFDEPLVADATVSSIAGRRPAFVCTTTKPYVGMREPPAMTSDPAQTARGFVTRFAATDADCAREAADLLTEEGRGAVLDAFPDELHFGEVDPEDALEGFWYGLYGQYGPFEDIGDVAIKEGTATVELLFADGTQRLELGVSDGGISDFALPSEYLPPAYANPEAFTERAVTVESGDVALVGVLTVPESDGPFPGVVLVHGSGIHDPDGTAGAAKILKDFAWGLATRGIAVLRYENRLHNHDLDPEAFTLDTVFVDDAVAALDELAAADEVDADALFVAGHSMGGWVAPRIADYHGYITGVVCLDTPPDVQVDPDDLQHLRYAMEPDGNLDEEQEAQLEAIRDEQKRISAGDYEPDEQLRGRPGRWHDSMKDCDPAGRAPAIDAPVFVVKIGRADPDVQPEMVEMHQQMLDGWRSVDLSEGSRIKFYDDLDHFFQTGYEPSRTTKLAFANNVAEHAIADLAEWILETGHP